MRKGQLKHSIKDMKELAEEIGYQCISEKYHGVKTKLKWLCKENHHFETTLNSFRRGTRCPICSRLESVGEKISRKCFETIFNSEFPKTKLSWLRNSKNNMMELDGYNKDLGIAFEYHGKQHYEPIKFFNRLKSLESRREDDQLKRELCKERNVKLIEIPYLIQYENIGKHILRGCKERDIEVPPVIQNFQYNLFKIYSPEKIKEMKELAKSKGGNCLSKVYINARKHLEWQCDKGHVWEATPDNVKRGYWCKKCADRRSADRKMSNIQEMHKLAIAKNFKFLSDKYLGARIKHKWQCNLGHIWEATPDNIKRGKGCPHCAGKRKTIKDLQKLAERKKGTCLSDHYMGARTKHRWQCHLGHIWEAVPYSIEGGTWCPVCYRNRRAKNNP